MTILLIKTADDCSLVADNNNLYGMYKQVTQLPQRDHAAGWVSYGKVEDWNSETTSYGHYRSIFNHCDVIGQQSNQIR